MCKDTKKQYDYTFLKLNIFCSLKWNDKIKIKDNGILLI